MRKTKLFLIGMAGVLLAFGMALTGCDEIASNAKKMADAVSDYTLTLAKTTDGQSYTAELYSNNVAVGGGVAKAASGSAIIKLTPYNGKPAFNGGTYKVRVTSGTTVKEKASAAFTTGGNTPLDWDTMTVIEGGETEEEEEEAIKDLLGTQTDEQFVVLTGVGEGFTYSVETFVQTDGFGHEALTADKWATATASTRKIGMGAAKAVFIDIMHEQANAEVSLTDLATGKAFTRTGVFLVVVKEKDASMNVVQTRYMASVMFTEGSTTLGWEVMEDTTGAFTSLASTLAYLNAHADGNTADNPVPLKLSINLSSPTNGWNALLDVLLSAAKYAALDLSSCSMSGTAFDLYAGDIAGKNYIVSLVLPDRGTSIANYSPDNSTYNYSDNRAYNTSYSKLSTISGANVISIGDYAFKGCTSLTTVSFPEATSIGALAFDDCTSLTSVSVPKATSIGGTAFLGCTSLTTVSFPEVTSVWFSDCTALIDVSAPKATSISFDRCTFLTSVYAPKATSVSFGNCTALTSVSFPEATSISFDRCTSLTSVYAPKATSVGFDACTALTTVSFPEATSVGFSGCTALTEVSASKATSIGYYAFEGCTSLIEVSFPEVTSIEDGAFYGCTGLTTASFPEVTNIGQTAFSGCTSLTSVSFPKATEVSFRDCTTLTSVYFPEATSVDFSGCTALTTVSLPKATSIGVTAFYNCTALTTVSFPEVSSIGVQAFLGCTSLTSVSFPKATSIGQYAFSGCTALSTVDIPKATSIGYHAFEGCTSLTTAYFPEVTNIGQTAFSGCTSLTSVSFPKVTDIESHTFSGFTYLTEVFFPEATSIGLFVFDGCTSLTEVSVPKVTSIGDRAFYNTGTTPLTITMGAVAPTVYWNIFQYVTGTKNVTVRVPSGATGYDETWQEAFKGYGNSETYHGAVNENINLVVEPDTAG